jgi:hypothetical protein
MSIKSVKKYYKNDIKIQDDIPVHEHMILENIRLSGNNLLQIDITRYKLKGKLEIIEILRELNMITDICYDSIKKEAVKILRISASKKRNQHIFSNIK